MYSTTSPFPSGNRAPQLRALPALLAKRVQPSASGRRYDKECLTNQLNMQGHRLESRNPEILKSLAGTDYKVTPPLSGAAAGDRALT